MVVRLIRDCCPDRLRLRFTVWTREAVQQLLVQRWLEVEYPAIRARAERESAEIQWGDEMGLRSDHQTGRSYGRRRFQAGVYHHRAARAIA